MPRLGALANRMYAPGVYESPEVAIPLGMTLCELSLERVNWPILIGTPRGVVDGVFFAGPDSEVARALIELSMDGGSTWGQVVREVRLDGGWEIFPTIVGFGTEGGDHFNAVGALVTACKRGFKLGDPTNPDRKGRLTMTIATRIRTELNVDVI